MFFRVHIKIMLKLMGELKKVCLMLFQVKRSLVLYYSDYYYDEKVDPETYKNTIEFILQIFKHYILGMYLYYTGLSHVIHHC